MCNTLILLLALLAGTAFAQQPVIDSMLIDESKGILSVYGDFGTTQGKVWCDSVELPVLTWSNTLVTATIPDSGKGSAGGVKIEDQSHSETNVRFVTMWSGVVTLTTRFYSSGSGYYDDYTLIHYSFRYDLHSQIVNNKMLQRTTSLMLGSKYEISNDEKTWANPMRLVDAISTHTSVPYYKDGVKYDSGFNCTLYLDFKTLKLLYNTTNAKGFIKNHVWEEFVDNSGGGHVITKSESFIISDDPMHIQLKFDSLFNIVSDISTIQCTSDSVFAPPPPRACALRNNPSIIAPKDDRDKLGTNDILLSWDTLKYMDAYHVQLSKDSIINGQKSGQHQQAVTYIVDTIVASLDFQLPHLEKNTKYYWRVCGVNTEGESRWSDVWSFTTGTSADVKQERKAKSLQVYPNPASSEVTIITSEPTRLLLYDMTGKLLRSAESRGEVTWNISTLPAGNYVLGTLLGEMRVVEVVK